MPGADSDNDSVNDSAEGGDAVCWLNRVCPGCGRLDDGPPPDRCPACGTPLADE
jgi:rubrerythrin